LRRVLLVFAVFAALFTGCSADGFSVTVPPGGAVSRAGVPDYGGAEEVFEVGGSAVEYIPLSIIYETENPNAAKYEPERGCYAGADVSSGGAFHGDIRGFEGFTGVDHAIFSCSMELGNEYPLSFVLSCVAAGKTPCVVINPPKNGGPLYDEGLLAETVMGFAAVNIPVFVVFYPYSGGAGFAPSDYISFFRTAAELFREYVPGAAVVWSVGVSDVYNCADYYPGDGAADWAGLGVRAGLERISGSDGLAYPDVMGGIEYFYFRYQKKKPIMLTELAVSHYSSRDNRYRSDDAARLIKKILAAAGTQFPRIKAYIYADEGLSDGGTDNFSVTGDGDVKAAYREAASGVQFLRSVVEEPSFYLRSAFRSAHRAYYGAGGVFIPVNALASDLGCDVPPAGPEDVYVNSARCVPAHVVERALSLYTELDAERGVLYIYK